MTLVLVKRLAVRRRGDMFGNEVEGAEDPVLDLCLAEVDDTDPMARETVVFDGFLERDAPLDAMPEGARLKAEAAWARLADAEAAIEAERAERRALYLASVAENEARQAALAAEAAANVAARRQALLAVAARKGELAVALAAGL